MGAREKAGGSDLRVDCDVERVEARRFALPGRFCAGMNVEVG
ncbi:MAG TPA: hypothetical protein VNQ90_03455 [Chthoniobacteraceae bacterium]|nr:hypothetical protein [Chthoniobacteraceae bacterium]